MSLQSGISGIKGQRLQASPGSVREQWVDPWCQKYQPGHRLPHSKLGPEAAEFPDLEETHSK